MIKSLPIYKIGVLVSIENSLGVGRKTFGDYITSTTNSEFLFFNVHDNADQCWR